MSSRDQFRGRGNRGRGGRGRGGNNRSDNRSDNRNQDSRRSDNRYPNNRQSDNQRQDNRRSDNRYPDNQTNMQQDRGYDQHLIKQKPPPAVFFVFDGVSVPNRYGNVNLKSINVSDLTEEDRLKIIEDAHKIIRNFSPPQTSDN